jgi:hypothetical protein
VAKVSVLQERKLEEVTITGLAGFAVLATFHLDLDPLTGNRIGDRKSGVAGKESGWKCGVV